MTEITSIDRTMSPANHKLMVKTADTLKSYRTHLEANQTSHDARWTQELELARGQIPFTVSGWCYPCQKNVEFRVDFEYSSTRINGSLVPNWRERVLCSCELNNRTRASIQIIDEILSAKSHHQIYIAEQVTPLYRMLKTRFPNLVGSEYLGGKIPFGRYDDRGVRNESITKLTFPDNTFDIALNFDVLEHIPDPEVGLAEIFRVLKPDGKLLLSVPFMPHEQATRVRAKMAPDGDVTHLLPPQYHGDPVSDSGCLCFQDFGWELLDQMRAIGFRRAEMLLYWSDTLGYYGVEQMVISAEK